MASPAAEPLRARPGGAPGGVAPSGGGVAPSDAGRINLSWLARLRWGAALGQLAMVALARGVLGIPLDLLPLLAIIGVEVASNVAVERRLRRPAAVSDGEIAAVMGLDVALLTLLFVWSGGASNPFTPLYLVYIALAAVVLRPAWTWSLVALALVCFGGLFLGPAGPGPAMPAHAGHAMLPALHLEGMWVAFGIGAAFIVYFVQRVARALERRERELAEAQAAQARAERLASLATLAAGAAHELSTPLSTIAVIARELGRALERRDDAADLRADVDLVRSQVERCREILIQMTADAGESTGEDVAATPIAEILRLALARLRDATGVQIRIEPEAAAAVAVVPVRAVAQAIRGIVKNALEASPAPGSVEIRASLDGERHRIEVRDRGPGMASDVLGRACEPFFTTKPPGHGMGLGLFLAQHVLERIGGGLELRSTPHEGTVAVVHLPVRRAETSSGAARAAA